MTLVTTKSMLKKAQNGGYAVGAFNTSNLEITKAIIRAAEELNSPVIIQASVSAIKYAGIDELSAIVHTCAKKTKIPIALHLDHGPSLEWVKKCIAHGFSSVMIDASSKPYEENVRITRECVRYANKYGIPVEAEIGALSGVEDDVKVRDSVYTNPDQAVKFVAETGCSSLAIAIGTSHGPYKFEGGSKLDFKRLEEIRERVKIPLVLHGASSIPQKIVKKAEKFGAKLGNPCGVSDAHLKKATKLGICKVNTDSDLRLAFDAALREEVFRMPEVYDPRTILSVTSDAIYETVKEKIKLLGSSGKA
ncbi:MAG: class II fructose-1,6-bisphosphate aldolase [Nanoarchaeota archaeon]